MVRQHKSPPIGSVSHGTMLSRDLIPAFLDELEYRNKKHAARIRKEYRDVLHNLNCERGYNCQSKYHTADDEWQDSASYMVDTLFDALNEYSLPYFYFGAHEGDGSDYGYWLSYEDLNYGDGNVVSVNAGHTWPKLNSTYVLEVNDHGNMTLYRRKDRKEIWSLV